MKEKKKRKEEINKERTKQKEINKERNKERTRELKKERKKERKNTREKVQLVKEDSMEEGTTPRGAPNPPWPPTNMATGASPAVFAAPTTFLPTLGAARASKRAIGWGSRTYQPSSLNIHKLIVRRSVQLA